MRIGSNIQAMQTLRRMGQVNRTLEVENRKLASGDRIIEAAVDPAGLAISEKMGSIIRGQEQAQRNINDGLSAMQVAEGSLSVVQELGTRLKELAMQAANDTLSHYDRSLVDREFQETKREMARIVKATDYNGRRLLDPAGGPYGIQVGVHAQASTNQVTYDFGRVVKEGSFGLSSVSVASKEGAQRAITQVDSSIHELSRSRADLASITTKMTSALTNMQIYHENTSSAKSRIRDNDVAEGVSKRAVANIQRSASGSMLDIVTKRPQGVLRLLE